MKSVKILFLLVSFLFTSQMTVKAQDASCYTKYSFKEFLAQKTINADEYVRTIYKKLVYPYVEENGKTRKLNEVVKVYLIHNNSESIEIIATKKIDNFDLNLISAFKKSNASFLKQDETKYITEIFIQLDFAPHDTFDRFDYSKIHILGYEIKY